VGTNEAGCEGCRFNLAIFISPFFGGLLQRPLEVIEALQERLKNYKGKDGEPVNREVFPKSPGGSPINEEMAGLLVLQRCGKQTIGHWRGPP